jgi:hypothetical protein
MCPDAYLDTYALGSGIALSAFHLRSGVDFPLKRNLTWGLEGEFYTSSPSDTAFIQGAILGIFRWHPFASSGFFLGSGPGLVVASSSDVAYAGGTAAYEDLHLEGALLGETGWTFSFQSLPLYIEPFLRGFVVGGIDSLKGSAVANSYGWVINASGEFGLRVGWKF